MLCAPPVIPLERSDEESKTDSCQPLLPVMGLPVHSHPVILLERSDEESKMHGRRPRTLVKGRSALQPVIPLERSDEESKMHGRKPRTLGTGHPAHSHRVIPLERSDEESKTDSRQPLLPVMGRPVPGDVGFLFGCQANGRPRHWAWHGRQPCLGGRLGVSGCVKFGLGRTSRFPRRRPDSCLRLEQSCWGLPRHSILGMLRNSH